MFGKRSLFLVLLLIAAIFLIQCQLKRPDEPEEILVGNSQMAGTLTDATNGQPIAGAIVTATGRVSKSANTDSTGNYELAFLPDGNYRIAATSVGYIPLTKIEILQVDDTADVDFVLSPGLGENAYRFVLTWSQSPSDLDAHLWDDSGNHIYYASRGSDSTEPFIGLDIDDVTSYGPETITVMELTGLCKFAVHNFSGTPEITSSLAHIDVYQGSDRIAYYDVPQAGSGLWWYVCDLTVQGAIVTRNQISNNPPVVGSPPALMPPKE